MNANCCSFFLVAISRLYQFRNFRSLWAAIAIDLGDLAIQEYKALDGMPYSCIKKDGGVPDNIALEYGVCYYGEPFSWLHLIKGMTL